MYIIYILVQDNFFACIKVTYSKWVYLPCGKCTHPWIANLKIFYLVKRHGIKVHSGAMRQVTSDRSSDKTRILTDYHLPPWRLPLVTYSKLLNFIFHQLLSIILPMYDIQGTRIQNILSLVYCRFAILFSVGATLATALMLIIL